MKHWEAVSTICLILAAPMLYGDVVGSAPHAADLALSHFPVDNSGFYVAAGAGAVLIDRNAVKFGNGNGIGGRNTVGVDPVGWYPAATGIIGFQFDKSQALEVSFFGSWMDGTRIRNSTALNLTGIDGSGSDITHSGGAAHFKSDYEAQWNDANIAYVRRLHDSGSWVLLGRAGFAGGTFDQRFHQTSSFNGFEVDGLTEHVRDFYAGPRIGLEGQYRYARHFWFDYGLNAGAMFGSAKFTGGETQFVGTTVSHLRAKDRLDYVAGRFGANFGWGWAPCRWASVHVGYLFEFWDDVPRIKNPSSGCGCAGPAARLGREDLLVHGVMAVLELRFP